MRPQPPDILQRIVADKKSEVAAARRNGDAAQLRRAAEGRAAAPGARLQTALRADRNLHIIAEIKRRSPSAGAIAPLPDAAVQARAYTDGGATAISVLTDTPYFGGSLSDLRAVRPATKLPLLRKDFIIDSWQIDEAAAAGADIILLIAAILDPRQAVAFRDQAFALGLDVLFEIHSLAEYEPFSDAEWPILGINNRDLHRFHTDRDTTMRLVPQLPEEALIVSESGFSSVADIAPIVQQVHGFLIGEALSRHPDPETELRTWRRQLDGQAPAPQSR